MRIFMFISFLHRSIGSTRWLLFAAVLGLVGCGDGNPPTYNIAGKIVYEDGTPVPGATVVFQPADGKNYPARGQVKQDGAFRLTSFKEGDGVVAGDHKVTLVGLPSADGPKPTRPAIPSQYGDADTSGLTATVTP